MSDEYQPRPTHLQSSKRSLLAWLSILACMVLLVVHYIQPDILAPVTLVPPWLWLIPGIFTIAISFRSISRATLVGAIGLWIVFVGMFVEEATSLLQFRSQPETRMVSGDDSSTLRVATLNCFIGSNKATKEPARFQPDIVFFQESTGLESLDQAAKDYFGPDGFAVHGGDVSIISRYKLQPIHVDPHSHFVHVVATLGEDTKVDLVSLRLSPPVFRMDFISSGFWTDHRDRRRQHREQLRIIRKHLEESAATENWILGGDFNLVGNDGALNAFEDLQDTFFLAGSGWCNTGTSNSPLFRVDQIWTTPNVECKTMKAYATENSDHRMVVVDLELSQ